MIGKVFKKFLRREKKKPFSAWQIELTTRCPLLCKKCIRAEGKDWQYQDMPLEDFKKILPYLKDVENVILEGWGESLLYKDLDECIRLIKKEGSQVGFVTSGKGLTEGRIAELMEAGIDFIGFSIAGTKEETHDAIRVNSHLPEILNAVRLFNKEKLRQKLNRPKIHLVFLMVKDNILEVPSVPSFAKEIEIEEVVLTNICHTINTWQENQRVFSWERGKNQYESFVKQAEANAKKLRISLKIPSLVPVDVPVCEENPLKNLYISAEGEVSPCVYLHPPLTSPFKRIFCGEGYRVEKEGFGNIFQSPFSTIWNHKGYLDFREGFRQRGKESKGFFLTMLDDPKIVTLNKRLQPDPPLPCRTCHKMLGV